MEKKHSKETGSKSNDFDPAAECGCRYLADNNFFNPRFAAHHVTTFGNINTCF